MNYNLKCINKDFLVREVYLEQQMLEKNEANYTLLELKKQNISTFDAINMIAEALQIESNLISYSGLKDEDAISEQLISIKKILSNDDLKKINCYNDISVGFRGYSNETLNIGRLHGNVFSIILRNINERDLEKIKKVEDKKLRVQSINYYDDQRFGIPNSKYNTHIIGKYILEENWDKAFEEYIQSGNSPSERERMIEFRKKNTARECFYECLDCRKIAFFLNSYMSELWNKQVNEIVIQSTAEHILFDENIMPLIFIGNGSKIALEDNYLTYEYFVVDDNSTMYKKSNKRSIVLYTDVMVGRCCKDELFPNKFKISLNFFLPSGCYATMLIKQLFYKL